MNDYENLFVKVYSSTDADGNDVSGFSFDGAIHKVEYIIGSKYD